VMLIAALSGQSRENQIDVRYDLNIKWRPWG